MKLLTRTEFRESVFDRDNNLCVVCHNPAQDAHHIMERRLFPDSGYYIDNGVSVCGEHHLLAESTELSCEKLRESANIKDIILPPHLYRDQPYDKWGNPILPNGMRLRGELFDDESVQKILIPVSHLFLDYVKYPRTYHLPWSPGITKDDRQIKSTDIFEGKDIVVTLKMDGENTNWYKDYCHARSLEYEHHESRSWMKALHGRIGYNIPDKWRVCCENLYAKHSIHYKNLDSFVQVFSIWNEKNICLSWEDTVFWAELLNVPVVPVLYKGVWDENIVRNLYSEQYNGNEMEGYVVRIADEFHYSQFRNSVAKYVRAGHVQSQHNWKFQKIVPNELKNDQH